MANQRVLTVVCVRPGQDHRRGLTASDHAPGGIRKVTLSFHTLEPLAASALLRVTTAVFDVCPLGRTHGAHTQREHGQLGREGAVPARG